MCHDTTPVRPRHTAADRVTTPPPPKLWRGLADAVAVSVIGRAVVAAGEHLAQWFAS